MPRRRFYDPPLRYGVHPCAGYRAVVPHLGPAAAAITPVPGLRVGVLLLLVLTDVMLRVRLAGDENLRPGRYASC